MKYSNEYLLGDIILDKNKFLFLSIPYDKGWQIKADEKNNCIKSQYRFHRNIA